MKADDKLVHVLGGIVHVLRCQADCSRAWRANLKTRPRSVAQRHVQTDVVRIVRPNVLFCRRENIHVTDHMLRSCFYPCDVILPRVLAMTLCLRAVD